MSNLIEKKETKCGGSRATNNLFTEFINNPKNELINNFEKRKVFSGFLRKKKRFKINVNIVTATTKVTTSKHESYSSDGSDYGYHSGCNYHSGHRSNYSGHRNGYSCRSGHRGGYSYHSGHRDGYGYHNDDWKEYRED